MIIDNDYENMYVMMIPLMIIIIMMMIMIIDHDYDHIINDDAVHWGTAYRDCGRHATAHKYKGKQLLVLLLLVFLLLL